MGASIEFVNHPRFL